MHSFRKYLRSKKDALDLPKWVYVQNWVNFMRKRSVRFSHINGRIICCDRSLTICAVHPNRAVAFNDGIFKRIQSLAQSYNIETIAFKPNDVIVDIGANIGELGIYFSYQHIPVRYIAFEPGSMEFMCLNQNVVSNELYNYAVWSHTCSITLYLNSRDADTSLIEPAHYDSKITIDAVSVDDCIDRIPIKLVKIDAEGAEPEVLMGATETLKMCEYVAVDTGPERGVNEKETTDIVMDLLTNAEFDLVSDIRGDRVALLFRRRTATTEVSGSVSVCHVDR